MTKESNESIKSVKHSCKGNCKKQKKKPESCCKEEQKTAPSYDELLDMVKRSQANLENFRKQTEKRIDEIRDFSKRDVITKFIPMIDSIDLAIKGMPKDVKKEMAEGMGMIHTQLQSTLEDLGLEEIPTTGEFNPILHEALAKVNSDKKEGEIIAVFQHGYQLHGKVLRAARVQVSAGPKK